MKQDDIFKFLMDYFTDGRSKNQTYKYVSEYPYVTVYYTTNLNNPMTDDKDYLESALKDAIKSENYELAIKLRDKIGRLNNPEIAELRSQLEAAVKDQNFERAIELRDEISKLTNKAHK